MSTKETTVAENEGKAGLIGQRARISQNPKTSTKEANRHDQRRSQTLLNGIARHVPRAKEGRPVPILD